MAPSMSLGVRPASLIASRAASAAIMRSERSGCWPATTPRPTIAYCPDDGCLGTPFSLSFVLRALCKPPRFRFDQADARARALRQPQHAVLRFEPLERVVEQAIELGKLAGVVDTWQRAGEMQRLRGEYAA